MDFEMSLTFSLIRRLVEKALIVTLLAMVILTFSDVLGRHLFNAPIYGAHDVTEHLMAIIVFCGLPLLTSSRGHLAVDLFDRFIMSDRMQWFRFLTNLLIAGILLLMSYQFMISAIDAVEIKEVSQELHVPRSYMYSFISISCLLSAIVAILPAQKSSGGELEEPL
ncbi:TRAP transporter small permease [Marinobacter alexandrii]|uniref:TRAP transporter small permease n=1 Tax=Marinobacter alexandrii TaxID=2570351 RepID=UPI001BB0F7D5|nr:TRAP transporter small permease [Marinobacter alexandrii]